MSIDKALVRNEVPEQRSTDRYRYRCPHCRSVDLRERRGRETPSSNGPADSYRKRGQRRRGEWYCKGCQTRVADEERIDMKNATDRSSSFYYGSETEQ